MSFSKNDLNFDFLSNVSEFKIIVKSSYSLLIISSIILKILLLAFLITIVFSLEKNDLDEIELKKFSGFEIMSVSKYVSTSFFFLFIIKFISSSLAPELSP